jgi:hypothetical protein
MRRTAIGNEIATTITVANYPLSIGEYDSFYM